MEENKKYDFFVCTIHKEDQRGICSVSPFTNKMCMVYRSAGIFGRIEDGTFTELESVYVTPLDLYRILEDFTVLRIDEPLFGKSCSMNAPPFADPKEVKEQIEAIKGSIFVAGALEKTKIIGKAPESALKDSVSLLEYLRGISAQG